MQKKNQNTMFPTCTGHSEIKDVWKRFSMLLTLKLWTHFCEFLSQHIRVILLTQHDFWLAVGCQAHNTFHIWEAFCPYLEVVWRFEWRMFYIGLLKVRFILASQEVLKWAWPSMNGYRLLFTQIQTLPPKMHHKWKRNYWYCVQNNQWKIRGNQLPRKRSVEF